jgi:hypothetical protein
MRATMPLSSRVYSAILLLYPRTLRREFGQEMVEVFSSSFATRVASTDGPEK